MYYVISLALLLLSYYINYINTPERNMNTTRNVILVNNTCADIREFDAVFIGCILNNAPLPEELADIFNLNIIDVDGNARGILTFA